MAVLKMTFKQNYEMRKWLEAEYGETMQLDLKVPILRKVMEKDLGFILSDGAIYRACADMGIKPVQRDNNPTASSLMARVAHLEEKFDKLLNDLGANTA